MYSGAKLYSPKAEAAAATLSVLEILWSLRNKAERAGFAMEMTVN